MLNRPGLFTGSGMPMRFADVDGRTIDVYQAATQMTDESGQSLDETSATSFTINALLDNAIGPKGYYGVFTANMHTDNVSHTGSEVIITSAQARGVPVVSARQMLDWLDGRNNSSFGGLAWSRAANTLQLFDQCGSRGERVTGHGTGRVGGRPLGSITRDGTPIRATRRKRSKGFAMRSSAPYLERMRRSYLKDTTPPVISALTHFPKADGTAVITWNTDEVSDSRIDYGTSPSALTLNAVRDRSCHVPWLHPDWAGEEYDLLLSRPIGGPRRERFDVTPCRSSGHLHRAGTVVHLHRYHGG